MAYLSERAARQLLAEDIERAGGVRAYARQHHVSAAFVSDARAGRRFISGSIARALGLRRVRRVTNSYLTLEEVPS